MTGPFHSGEREIQRRAGVVEEAQDVGRIIGGTLTPAVGRFLARQRLAVASTLDAGGRVWASLLSGVPGFISPDGTAGLRIAARPIAGDPLEANLAKGGRPEIGLVVLDPQTRQRMRVNGVIGATGVIGRFDDSGFRIDIRQVYGNCPKYIQLREAETDAPRAKLRPPTVTGRLDERQREWIGTADTLFIASFHPQGGADASHRGGRPGFIHVIGDGRLVFPDYPGNAMFNTLGNLVEYPRAGLLFVDFATGDVLQLTGTVALDDSRSVTFDVQEVRETRAASPLRMRLVEYSPASPRVTPQAGEASNDEKENIP
jgi:predicted pyridoxine 5'-phosphate oxidase superfamily flavin-nucleotide-binding protein